MALDSSLNVVVKLVDNASSGLKSMGKNFESFGDKIDQQTKSAQTFTKAVVGIGAVVGGIALNEFTTFQKTMSGIKAVLSPTSDEFERMSELAKQLGKDSVYSQQEVAASMEELAKNGLTATQILNGAGKAVTDLAAATSTDLTTSATIASDAMNIFGIRAEEMSKAINGISGVAVASKFDVNDYALALSQGGGVAKAVGVSFDDFNTSISKISNLFASGSDAGTSFKVFLQRLVPASDKAYEAMQSLGIVTKEGANTFFDASGKMKSMSDISQILNKALSGLSDEQKNQALSTIFGTDAMRAAVGLAEGGSVAFDKVAESISKVDAAEQAKTRLDNIAGAFEKVKGSVSVVLTNFGEYLEKQFQIQKGLEGLSDAIDNLGANFQKLSPEMQTTITVIGGIVGGFAGLVAAIGAVGIVTPMLLSALTAISTAMSVLLSPIGLIVVAIAGLFIAWQTNFLGIRDITNSVISFIGDKIGQFLDRFTKNWGDDLQEIWTSIKTIFETIKNVFVTAFKGWSELISMFINENKGTFNTWFEWLKAIFNTSFEFLKNYITNILNGIFNIIKGSLQVIQGVFEFFFNLLTGNWDKLGQNLMTIINGFWNIIKGVFQSSFAWISAAFQTFQGTISGVWNGMTSALGNAWTSMWDTIKSWAKNSVDYVLGLVNSLKDTINSVVNSITGTIDGIKSKVSGAVDYVGGKVSGIGGAIGNIGNIFKAEGGPVSAGNFHIVGERGPEAFIPRTDGTIISNEDLMRAMGGSGSGTSVNINVNFSDVKVSNGVDLQNLKDTIVSTLRTEMRRANLGLTSI